MSLYDYRARCYDPLLGRFTQADTVVPEPGNPQALNRYAYTLNNPVKYTDPSGHWVLWGFEATAGPVDEMVRFLEAKHGVYLQPYKQNLNMRMIASLDKYYEENPRAFLDNLAPEIDPFPPQSANAEAREILKQAGAMIYQGEKQRSLLQAVKSEKPGSNPVSQDDIRTLTSEGTLSPLAHSYLFSRIVGNSNNVAIVQFLDVLEVNKDIGSNPTNYEPNYLAELMVYHKDAIWAARTAYDWWRRYPQSVVEKLGPTGTGD